MQKLMTLILCLGLAAAALADNAPAGVITALAGKVSLYSAAKPDKAGSPKLGQQLYAGDRLQTGANGRAGMVLTDGTQLKVNYNTDITLRDKDSKGKASERGIASIKLALGDLWAKVTKKNSRLEFETASAVAAVKGTTLALQVATDELCAKLVEGRLDVTNDLGGVSLSDLQMVCVKKGSKPGSPVSWDGKTAWPQEIGGARGAEVELKWTEEGQEKSLILEYGK